METDVLVDGKWVSTYEWVTPAEQAAFVEQYESEARILAKENQKKRMVEKSSTTSDRKVSANGKRQRGKNNTG